MTHEGDPDLGARAWHSSLVGRLSITSKTSVSAGVGWGCGVEAAGTAGNWGTTSGSGSGGTTAAWLVAVEDCPVLSRPTSCWSGARYWVTSTTVCTEGLNALQSTHCPTGAAEDEGAAIAGKNGGGDCCSCVRADIRGVGVGEVIGTATSAPNCGLMVVSR